MNIFYFWHKISIIGNYEKCDFSFTFPNFIKFSSSLRFFLVFLSELPVSSVSFSTFIKLLIKFHKVLQLPEVIPGVILNYQFLRSRSYSDAQAPFSTFIKLLIEFHEVLITFPFLGTTCSFCRFL